MPISLSEAVQTLLSGDPLPWTKFGAQKAGSVQLTTPAARRLFHHLLSCDLAKVTEANETLFDGLINAWKNTAFDPATAAKAKAATVSTATWRLIRLESSGFGGLNVLDGPEFTLPINGENWCLEGQNGSGKTSFASAIIWALTGYRCRDQDGIVFDEGSRQPVFNDSGVQVGDWPTLVSYPSTPLKLKETAETWVRLTFQDDSGNTSQAYRKLTAPASGDPTFDIKVDPALLVAPQLIETGLLMPARLSRIGFGERSQSIYEAVKLLTGLDQLADIGEGAANFAHKSKRFLKYGQDNGIQAIETKMGLFLMRAEEEAQKAGFEFKIKRKREDQDYSKELRGIAAETSTQAGEHLAILTSDIAKELDTNKPEDRTKIRTAVGTARGLLQQGVSGIAAFEAWAALATAKKDEQVAEIPQVISDAKARLTTALMWDKRQSEDNKLRLKALASQFFVPAEHDHDDANCPICENALTGDKRKKLAAELAELKKSSDTAERKLVDVCAELEKGIRALIPKDLTKHFDLLIQMKLPQAFENAALERFANNAPFSTVLTGIAEFTKATAKALTAKLPAFEYDDSQPDPVPTAARDLSKYIRSVERLFSLIQWWDANRQPFRDAWALLKGMDDGNGKFAAESLEGKLASLEAALDKAAPLEEITKALNSAADEADEWHAIYLGQLEREQIAKTLEPVKELRTLVSVETASSISALSGRMKSVLDRIHFRERLSFEDAALIKKTVQIAGSFDHGLRVDASTVANTSWLRAILWAFILALREQTLETLGKNPFPLVVLDDPQVTFDPRNKRKWAEEIARLANMGASVVDAAQLVLTTHERQFFQFLVNIEKLAGQQGLIVCLNAISKVATVINGTSLARTYKDAKDKNDDELGHKYVLEIRTYCEDLLRIMLRSEGPGVINLILGDLAVELKRLRGSSVAPFNRQPFEKLLDTVAGGGGAKPMKLINDAHHKYDGTIGLAQATEVKQFWEKTLQTQIHTCFKVFAEYEAYSGEPRLFSWMDDVIEFPEGNAPEIKKLNIIHTGIAAAAKTDGRVGDGLITLEQLKAATKIVLSNHTVFQLAAGTLEPVASVGDFIIVSNYAPVNQRNLIVATCGDQLLARRYNEAEIHPHIAILTGQAVDPYDLPQPIIVPKEKISTKKIVGTLFAPSGLPVPPRAESIEFVALSDPAIISAILDDAKLFKVSGRSAEPIALDGQYIITQPVTVTKQCLDARDGRLVIAVDENGARYFKRLRKHGEVFVLESLNPDGTTSGEILSTNGQLGFPKLVDLLDVIGVLFELP